MRDELLPRTEERRGESGMEIEGSGSEVTMRREPSRELLERVLSERGHPCHRLIGVFSPLCVQYTASQNPSLSSRKWEGCGAVVTLVGSRYVKI